MSAQSTSALACVPAEIMQRIAVQVMDGPLRLQVYPNMDWSTGYVLSDCFDYFHCNKRHQNNSAIHRQLEFTGVQLTNWRQSCRQIDQMLRPMNSITATKVIEICDETITRMFQRRRIDSDDRKRIVPFPFDLAQFTTAIVNINYQVKFVALDDGFSCFRNLRKIVLGPETNTEVLVEANTYESLCSGNMRDSRVHSLAVEHAFPRRGGGNLTFRLQQSMVPMMAIIRFRPKKTELRSAAIDVLLDLRDEKVRDVIRYRSLRTVGFDEEDEYTKRVLEMVNGHRHRRGH